MEAWMKATIGTRVILLAGGASGVVVEERHEPYLKRFVVKCDDGHLRFASPSDLALESDPARLPLGPPIHD